MPTLLTTAALSLGVSFGNSMAGLSISVHDGTVAAACLVVTAEWSDQPLWSYRVFNDVYFAGLPGYILNNVIAPKRRFIIPFSENAVILSYKSRRKKSTAIFASSMVVTRMSKRNQSKPTEPLSPLLYLVRLIVMKNFQVSPRNSKIASVPKTYM